MEQIHLINIIIHVVAGTVALVAGFAAISFVKGSKKHVRFGRFFVKMIVIVIVTGLIGVFVFKRNTFLLVITLLSGYTAYTGIRALKLRGNKPASWDHLISIIVLGSGLYYLYYIKSIGLFWAPAVIYSTLGALSVVTIYDLLRAILPENVLVKAYMYEHVYKMVSSLIAITSAFTGTVLPQFKPYSQILPSLFGFAYIALMFIRLSKKSSAGILSQVKNHEILTDEQDH